MGGLDSRSRSAEPDLTAYVRGARKFAIDGSSIVRRCAGHKVSYWIRLLACEPWTFPAAPLSPTTSGAAQPRAGAMYP